MTQIASTLYARLSGKALLLLVLMIVALVATHFDLIHPATFGLMVPMAGMAFLDNESIVLLLRSLNYTDALNFLKVVRSVVVKAVNYTVLITDGSGTMFTTRGAAGAVTFTLPSPILTKGVVYEFFNAVDQNMIVSAGAGLAMTFNNAAAASLAASTAGQKIGAVIRAYSDGTSWHLQGSTIGVTYTVA